MPDAEQLRVLRKEVSTDLKMVARLSAELAEARATLPRAPDQKGLSFIAYPLHGVYTAWESAMKRIAVTFENRLEPARWHAHLLQRMTLDLPGIRPPLISEDYFLPLERLRSFRQFFRHNYATPFETERLELVLKSYDAVAPHMQGRFKEFLGQVERIAGLAEED